MYELPEKRDSWICHLVHSAFLSAHSALIQEVFDEENEVYYIESSASFLFLSLVYMICYI